MRATFFHNAKRYVEAGFTPLPWHVVDGSKHPAARGYLLPNPPIGEWMSDFAHDEIGIISRGWLGVDIDSSEHGGKSGEKTVQAIENTIGPLPKTFSSTARGADSISRIHFFSIPEDGRRFRDVGKDVEAIRPGHRFAAVYPSIHPNGKQYEWYDPNGRPLNGIPSRYEFPPLPDNWIEYLTAPARREGGYDGSVQDWLDALPGDEVPDYILARLEALEGNFDNNQMFKSLASLVSSGAKGVPGIRQAIEIVHDRWLRGEWDNATYREEFDNALDWAVAHAGGKPKEEEEQEPVEEKFKQFSEARLLPVDRGSLAEALRVFCTRIQPSSEQSERAAEKFKQCVGLLPHVKHPEDAAIWLDVAKKAMTKVLKEES